MGCAGHGSRAARAVPMEWPQRERKRKKREKEEEERERKIGGKGKINNVRKRILIPKVMKKIYNECLGHEELEQNILGLCWQSISIIFTANISVYFMLIRPRSCQNYLTK
jgi:hypothetical protein